MAWKCNPKGASAPFFVACYPEAPGVKCVLSNGIVMDYTVKRLSPLFLALALCACNQQNETTTDASQQPQPTPVKELPSKQIGGIELGQAANLQECEKERAFGSIRYKYEPTNTPCWQASIFDQGGKLKLDLGEMPQNTSVEVNFGRKAIPDGIYHVGKVTTMVGKIEDVTLETQGVDRQQEIYELLAAKWGQPTSTNVERLQNGFGARYDSVEAFWALQGISIQYIGMLNHEQGLIIFRSDASNAQMRERDKKLRGAESF